MPSLLAELPTLFAQAAQNKPAEGGSSMWTLLIYIWIPLLFYFIIFRPGRQEERKRKEMLAALKKNDKVLTSAGIYGTVVSIDNDADRVLLRVDDDRGVRMAFSRASITRVLEPAPEKEKAAEAV
jgi:preprotein translocase subunit YajC